MPEEYIRVEEEAQHETDASVEAAHFDAFQGIVLEHAPTKGGRVKEMKILTLPRFLENSQGIYSRSFDSDAVYLTVNFDPDSSALPRKRDFPLGCPVQGQVQGEVTRPKSEFRLWDYILRCVPGSFALVRDEAEELALLDGLHEGFDDQVRQELKTQGNSEQTAWLRFFLRRSRRRLSSAGLLRAWQRSRRLHGDWSETRIINEGENGLSGIVLAALVGSPKCIPRILACGAPTSEGANAEIPWQGCESTPIGSHRQGWYNPGQFCAIAFGNTLSPPHVLEGRITVPEERLPELFAWIRLNRHGLNQLYRMGSHRAADHPLLLRRLEDAPAWIHDPESYEDPWTGNKLFKETIIRLFGDALRRDEHFCTRFWSALANIDWLHRDGLRASFSFRGAGSLIADIRGEEGEYNYIEWYMSGPDGMVHSEIAAPLAQEGWMWEAEGDDTDIVDIDMRNEMTVKDKVVVITAADGFPGDRLGRLEKTWTGWQEERYAKKASQNAETLPAARVSREAPHV